jgi:hypothetical protein
MVLALGGGVGFLYGQALTAQIAGAVNDPTGHLVPGARVELNNMEIAQRRVGQADASGNFFFAQLFPGTYRISVRAAGFKRHEEANIFVATAERVVLRSIALQLGDVTESVTVAAEGARGQTQSAERGALIDRAQIQVLPTKGRDIMEFVRCLEATSRRLTRAGYTSD